MSGAGATLGTMLTDRDRAILNHEALVYRSGGTKDAAIRDTFGYSATRHYQILAAALAHPDAMAHDAVTVKRLVRLQEKRRAVRTASS